jgi:hypothetical protein
VISIKTSISTSVVGVADRSAVVSACPLGFSALLNGTGLSGVLGAPAAPPAGLPVPAAMKRRDERPTEALEAGVAAAQAQAYAFAATGAGTHQTTQHHTKWAFRGLEPWSHPA